MRIAITVSTEAIALAGKVLCNEAALLEAIHESGDGCPAWEEHLLAEASSLAMSLAVVLERSPNFIIFVSEYKESEEGEAVKAPGCERLA